MQASVSILMWFVISTQCHVVVTVMIQASHAVKSFQFPFLSPRIYLVSYIRDVDRQAYFCRTSVTIVSSGIVVKAQRRLFSRSMNAGNGNP
jgi:hypothetical protein